MKKSILSILSIVLITCASCGDKQSSQLVRPAFSADSAYSYIQQQMDFGPRVPNSQAHLNCVVYLLHFLRSCGAEVELQQGTMTDYSGRPQAIFNIIGRFDPVEPTNRARLLLAAHYDTRPWADEEENYEDRYVNVPGANDGASGVGVLLEVARQLSQQLADSTLTTPVDIVFFDCEDMGTPQFYTGVEREDTWCLGSQLWATEYLKKKNSNTAYKVDNNRSTTTSDDHKATAEYLAQQKTNYQYGILLDMVGAPDAVFPREFYSMQYAGNYVEEVWRTAETLGHGKYFTQQTAYPILDDHYYVNTIAGIPCLDIIHYDARNATGFAPWWHTREDDMRNINRATLQAVGETIMAMIH